MKQKILAVSVVVALLLGTVGYGLYAFSHKTKNKRVLMSSSESGSILSTSDQASMDASGGNQSEGSALGVSTDSGAGGGNGSTLQSNLSAQSSGSSNSSASKIPGPESFKQYEQYKEMQIGEIQQGSGNKTAETGSKVAVVYKGWLTNGTLFDQSKTNADGKIQAFPFTIGAGQVIQGWEVGLIGMKVGGVRRLIIPSAMGYGPSGSPPIIPANAMLIFDVQLVTIE